GPPTSTRNPHLWLAMTTDPLASALSSPHDGAPTPEVGTRLAPIPAAVQRDPRAEEHDACALIANIRKKGQASHGNVKRTIEALMRMSHRSGVVEGEGDGCGVLTDIPRKIWARRLVDAGLFEAVAEHPRFFVGHMQIERDTRVHVVSLSADSAVYKIRGSAEALMRYYPELRHPEFLSAVTVGHNRYSTNTASAFERVQPFTILGHNGEINTI